MRNEDTADRLLTVPDDSVRTCLDLINHAAKQFDDRRCLGSRALIQEHVEERPVCVLYHTSAHHAPTPCAN